MPRLEESAKAIKVMGHHYVAHEVILKLLKEVIQGK